MQCSATAFRIDNGAEAAFAMSKTGTDCATDWVLIEGEIYRTMVNLLELIFLLLWVLSPKKMGIFCSFEFIATVRLTGVLTPRKSKRKMSMPDDNLAYSDIPNNRIVLNNRTG